MMILMPKHSYVTYSKCFQHRLLFAASCPRSAGYPLCMHPQFQSTDVVISVSPHQLERPNSGSQLNTGNFHLLDAATSNEHFLNRDPSAITGKRVSKGQLARLVEPGKVQLQKSRRHFPKAPQHATTLYVTDPWDCSGTEAPWRGENICLFTSHRGSAPCSGSSGPTELTAPHLPPTPLLSRQTSTRFWELWGLVFITQKEKLHVNTYERTRNQLRADISSGGDNLDSNHSPATFQLCDLRQVTYLLQTSVFPLEKQGE